MNSRITLILAAVIAVAAVGTTTMMTTTVEAKGPPAGSPYGDLVSGEAHTGERGFGGDVQAFCSQGTCGANNQHLGDFRASDEAGKSPGKFGEHRDETAGNPNN
ncbi:MAG: hypothetical protein WB053_06185 [Nitrososphaeraceae archaeon]